MSVAISTQWPRRRLQIRSILSATMPIGWVWVAATALIPYFLIGKGRGAGSVEILGITRTTWMSFHVWSSIVVGLLTIGHILLNRRGLARSYRIVSGAPRRDISGQTSGGRSGNLTWVAAVAVVLVAVGGSWAFAAADGEPAGTGSSVVEAELDRDRLSMVEDEAGTDVETTSENQRRGGQSDKTG